MTRAIIQASCDVGMFCAGGAVMFGLLSESHHAVGGAGFVAAILIVLFRPFPNGISK